MFNGMKKRSLARATPLSTLIFLAGCALLNPTPPIADSICTLHIIYLDPGFETRLTRNEREQIDSFDKTVSQKCHN